MLKLFASLVIGILLSGSALSAHLFDESSVLEIHLAYDITKLQAEKENLREKGLPAKLTTALDGKAYMIEVMARGKGSFVCQQPQLKLKFDKKENSNNIFQGIKNIKLFTKGTCLENKQDDEQDKQIIANYLIYKLYEEFSEYSYKTRLLKITYTDLSKSISDYTQYGFFLEPSGSFEKRLNLTSVEEDELHNLGMRIPELTNPKLLTKVNSFEFFIANYDYGIPGFFSHIINDSGNADIYYGEKNSKMYKSTSGELYPVIYDFDFSRFGYFVPTCMFGYKFFMNDEQEFNFECSVDAIAANVKSDLAKFRYASDVKSYSDELIKAQSQWEKKHLDLISLLGSEYKKGMAYFIEAFKLTVQ